jgi:hypothetical protein
MFILPVNRIFQEYFRSIPHKYPVIKLSTSVTTEINFKLEQVESKFQNQQSHKKTHINVCHSYFKHVLSENRTTE